MLVLSQCPEYCVCRRADPALQRQERLRYDSTVHVCDEELGHVVSDLVRYRVAVLECACLVRQVTLNDTSQPACIKLYVWFPDAVAHMLYWDWLAVWRVERLIHVVDVFRVGAVEAVQLEYHAFLCEPYHCWRDTSCGGQIAAYLVSHLLDVAHFDYRPVNVSEEAVAQFLRHLREVYVVVCNLPGVDALAEVSVGGVWRAVFYCLCLRHHAVGALPGRCPCEKAHLEGTACGMFCLGLLGQFPCYCLCCAGWRESAHAYVLVILDKCGGFRSRDTCICHSKV